MYERQLSCSDLSKPAKQEKTLIFFPKALHKPCGDCDVKRTTPCVNCSHRTT